MTKLQKKYEEYLEIKRRYIEFREDIMKEPRRKLKSYNKDLQVEALETEFGEILQRKRKKAWDIYKKLYFKNLNKADADMFVKLANEIMGYTEFLNKGEIEVWMVSRDLVQAYGQAFVGTQDEYDQKSIL